MRRWLAFLLAAGLLVLCACGGQSQQSGGLTVYRVLKRDFQTDGELLRTETIRSDAAPTVHSALNAVFSEPADPMLSNGMQGAKLLDWSLAGGEAAVELSAEYGALTDMDKTVAEYCLTLTLCQLDGVDAVSIYCSGEPTALGLTAADVLLYDARSNPYEKQVHLYFSDGGRFLAQEVRSLSVDEDIPAERYMVEELLRGPMDEGLTALLPAGTRLLSVSTRDGLCTVDLSAEFLQGEYPSEQHRRLAIYSLVNTLTALSGVEAVALCVRGEPVRRFGALELPEALYRYEAVIGPVNTARGDLDTALYYPAADGGPLLAAPLIIAGLDYDNEADALLAQLTDPEGERLFHNPFAGVEVLDTELEGGVYTVDLPGSFFQTMSQLDLNTAVSMLVRSLTALPTVRAVRILRDGEALTLYGTTYTQPIASPPL